MLPTRYYELLYNPGNAAQIEWRKWPRGTWDLNFPQGVFKSDEECDLMVGRYNDGDETALITKDGYVYYTYGLGSALYWDNNEYDLLVERTVTGIVYQRITVYRVTHQVVPKLSLFRAYVTAIQALNQEFGNNLMCHPLW